MNLSGQLANEIWENMRTFTRNDFDWYKFLKLKVKFVSIKCIAYSCFTEARVQMLVSCESCARFPFPGHKGFLTSARNWAQEIEDDASVNLAGVSLASLMYISNGRNPCLKIEGPFLTETSCHLKARSQHPIRLNSTQLN